MGKLAKKRLGGEAANVPLYSAAESESSEATFERALLGILDQYADRADASLRAEMAHLLAVERGEATARQPYQGFSGADCRRLWERLENGLRHGTLADSIAQLVAKYDLPRQPGKK